MKHFLTYILKQHWFIKARIRFFVYGPYGVSNTVKNAPFPFIIPLLKKYGAKIGEKTIIDTGIIIHRPDKKTPFKNLSIGNSCYIGHNVTFDLTDTVIISDDVAIGASCQFWTHTGDFSKRLRDGSYKEKIAPVLIKEQIIIYSGAIISSGVSISEKSRVGAGSVVLKDVETNCFYAGNPAKKVKNLNYE